VALLIRQHYPRQLETSPTMDNVVDLTNCDLEPIHIPGLIQPHGVLLVLEPPTLRIVQVSKNTKEVLDRKPEDLLGKPLSDLLDDKQIQVIWQCLEKEFESANPLDLSIKRNGRLRHFDGIVHALQPLIVLELERRSIKSSKNYLEFYQQVRGVIAQTQRAQTLLEMSQVVVESIRRITGFDRVMVYRFDKDGSGIVIAEDTNQETPYLNLRYPPSDIPKQARQLYNLNWLRLIPNVSYDSVSLIPENNPVTNQPLDLSQSVLRSVSPIHLEYLKNMKVAASMSISLMQDQKLWGLIACHHSSPKFVPYLTRTVCELIGRVMSVELANKESSEEAEYKIYLKLLQTRFIEALSESRYFLDGILKMKSQLLNLANATGAVIFSGDLCIQVGGTPSIDEIRNLMSWIKPQLKNNLFETESLTKLYPAAEAFEGVASGLLALEISKAHNDYILWFRPELVQTVTWGGDPNKPVEVVSDGSLRMSPRKSFAMWQEILRGHCLPWKSCEIEAAIELRSLVVGIMLRQADEMAAINFELKRSNEELDSFAYIASHDLKEPLRGIHNYANFLMEDYANLLREDGVLKLKTLVRLTQRMETLINSLLYISRVGRAELTLSEVNLNELVQQVINTVSMARPEPNIEFRIPRILPSVHCDQAQVNELLTNLVSNAIKYNNKAQKWIEVGFIDGMGKNSKSRNPTFYIRDNGIGIPQEHIEKIFVLFRRLHGRDDYGGGTGAGLTIARKVVERHGGRIWVESIVSEGSTFYFKLSPEVY
jgi:two-component system, chemotaxis family, sensor kinase Cph1